MNKENKDLIWLIRSFYLAQTFKRFYMFAEIQILLFKVIFGVKKWKLG